MNPSVNDLNGLLVVDKPSGPTSYDLIRWLKSRAPGVKIGHCGTLDPMASGVMILLLGPATKSQAAIMGADKIYRWRIRLGIRTDTGDVTGAVHETKNIPSIADDHLRSVLQQFVGERSQMPPMYSALKKNGVPLYKLARKGESVERLPRTIHVREMEFLGRPTDDEFEGRFRCSSGTYVRTLAEEMAEALGTVGTLSALIRESVGPYDLMQALPGEQLKALSVSELSEKIMAAPVRA